MQHDKLNTKCRYCGSVTVAAVLLFMTLASGCGDQWRFAAVRDVRADLPNLMDRQWQQRRDYTPDEMLDVYAGGGQTLLVASKTRPGTWGDVAQLDEDVRRTYVIVLDEVPQAGKTYRITPDNGRLIEGTNFRPSWRPYRGIEGELTVLAASDKAVTAAVRATTLWLKKSEAEHRLTGTHTFDIISGDEPWLRQAQIDVGMN